MEFTMKKKLIVFLVAALLISVAMGVMGFLNLLTLKKIVNYNENIVAKPLAYIAETNFSYGMSRVIIRDLIISEADADEKLHDQLLESLDIIQTQLSGYKDTLTHNGSAKSEEYDKVANLILQTKEWTKQIKIAEELIAKNKKSEAIAYLKNDVEQNGEAINASIQELIDLNKEQANNSSQVAESIFAQIVIKMIFIILVGVFVLALLGLLIIRSITKPVARMIVAANQLAEGITSINLATENNDEIGQLEKAISRVSESIATVVNDTETILTASRQGDFLQHADATKHKGVFAKVIQDINRTNDTISNHLDNIDVSIAFFSINKKIVYKNKAMIDFVRMFHLNSDDENILARIMSLNKSVDLSAGAELVFKSKTATTFENTITMLDPATNQNRAYNLALYRNDGQDADLDHKCVMVTISDATVPV